MHDANQPPCPEPTSASKRGRLRRASGLALLLVMAAGVAFVAGRSSAAGVPLKQPLTYSGSLFDDSGQPLSGKHEIVLRLLPTDSDDASPLCETTAQIEPIGGQFDVSLNAKCTAAFQNSPDVWLEAIVDSESMGRTKTGVVPYALEAQRAKVADLASAATDDLAKELDSIRTRLDGLSCPKNYYQAGPHLCVESGALHAPAAPWDAIGACSAQGDHLCSQMEMQQVCASRGVAGSTVPADFNPYSGEARGMYSDHAADDTYVTWNVGACNANNDGLPVAVLDGVPLPFRCCR
ncbi:MAG TPA: hypothetical protein VFQ61_12890 [Polyangiaceae bacterium]|nr:hypothetical protein [Polyangiaceae bacterium]